MGWSSSKTSSGGGGGGGVQSVTGLNTDNTDPTNPIVDISVDGTTITGAGTPVSPLVGNFVLEGTNYLSVLAKGDPTENGRDLILAYQNARTMTPNGATRSATNRITIYLASGYYSFNEGDNGQFIIDTSFIDFVSLSGQRDVYFSSIEVLSNTLGIDVLINGIDITKNAYYTEKSFAVASSGGFAENIIIKNCKGDLLSFGAFGSGFKGLYENCEGGDFSFCFVPNLLEPPSGMTLPSFWTGGFNNFGIIRNCNATIGFVGSAITTLPTVVRNFGTIENCNSASDGFVYSVNTCFNNGTIKNCTASTGFCVSQYATRNLGTIENCVGKGEGGFCCTSENVDGNGLASNNGLIQNCTANQNSFCFYAGISESIYVAFNSGTIRNCSVTDYVGSSTNMFCINFNAGSGYNEGIIDNCSNFFGEILFCGEYGLNAGFIQNCVAGSKAFCNSNPTGIELYIFRCTLINGFWTIGTTGGGKVILGIDLTGVITF
jgi:hypothetical protein